MTSINRCILIGSVIFITCTKFLLIPSYRSTDFDVHRNWLAITRNLPISDWYFDDNSKTTVHTLDYPPLFAFFEAFLSKNYITDWALETGLVDQRCFERLPDYDNTPTEACIFFQRCTVILSDLVFIIGAYFASHSIHSLKIHVKIDGTDEIVDVNREQLSSKAGVMSNADVTTLLIILNPGILLLDHVHFQYNGMLLGLLLLSIGFMARGSILLNSSPFLKENYDIMAAFVFAALLTMKHLYLTLAPLYFIYLLRHCCFQIKSTAKTEKKSFSLQFAPWGFMKLAMCTLCTIIIPFTPFILSSRVDPFSQMSQIFQRLFPFSRGLCHDYWAANVWALYTFADKCLSFILRKIGADVETYGLIEITPLMAALLLLLSLIPVLWFTWIAAGRLNEISIDKQILSSPLSASERILQGKMFFTYAVVYSSFCSFMLAYHVHEKAIMTVIIPMTLFAPTSRQNAQLYLRTCTLGHFALLPLLYKHTELVFKISSFIAHLSLSVFLLEYVMMRSKTPLFSREDSNRKNADKNGLLTVWDKIAFFVIGISIIFSDIIHPLVFKTRQMMEFLPLMMTSVICAIGLIICWIHSGVLLVHCCRNLAVQSDSKKIN